MNVMYFSTSWCGPCKTFKPVVNQVSQELGISIQFIDAEASADLANNYSISSVPTIIITDDQGLMLYRHSGVMQKEELTRVLSSFR